ncbi:GDP-mannose transporter GONST5 [Abeliophyllum distichum]|uniref:GDP-mannose transporter GONST5 n=1 Tax=Abeliophyllum distichum TaxID=126358 RepID=A0ABD1SSB2_9LAMI
MEESVLCQWSVIRSILAILQWWSFNVTVIIMNKWIFQKLDFKYPLSVSCIHFICSAIGAYLVIKVLKLKPLIPVETRRSLEEDFSHVICILYQHSFGECEPALHSCFFYANHKVVYAGNNCYPAVASLEKALRLANLGFFDSHCWRDSPHFYDRA